MSDASEVKRWEPCLKDSPAGTFVTVRQTRRVRDVFVKVEDHDRIVAELKAEVIKLNSKLGFLIGVLEGIVVYANDSDMRREFARKALEKLEQQGEGM